MNPAYTQFLAAASTDRRDVFIGAGQRLGTASQTIEKDFWVCWTLDALFNGPASQGPRFLFKGGPSRSKGFSLIQRFSEDIDFTVFREDIGEALRDEYVGQVGHFECRPPMLRTSALADQSRAGAEAGIRR